MQGWWGQLFSPRVIRMPEPEGAQAYMALWPLQRVDY